ncbi:hypothetical protein PHLGIDRAFT_96569 [Phlebiopsis gigantea 11061_1 CR5-6]|uniref:FAD-binding domain-containing protein n=1 Tax=Phlebiopsis gigantea (strain 11061_1 CR5-6) TaxID=745531 RepID=A0A0C3NBP9_PHLG1|nr:hypothetical protein PHLGIDRAFT_96569 [Phlebiopsis gigantea 11061_1 CR5-6]
MSTRVGVIGAGIAGPLLAMLLKQKGYEPVVFERNPAPSEAGIGIGVQPNGIRVIESVPGLFETIKGRHLDEFHFFSVIPEDTSVLAELQHPKKMREATGRGTFGIRRSELQKAMVAHAETLGIEFKWSHKLETLEQAEDSVTVTFANGAQETFSFVVGCDGLHSNTRICLFGEQPADYTGLIQVGGYGPSPAPLKAKGNHTAMNVFGDGVHMIAVPIDEDTMGFAVTMREPEAKETWRAMDEAGVAEFKKSAVSEWPYGAGEIVKNGWNVTKYGLYDRPELKTWHQGRVVLIGDAAHPTSPHLGQGANQSFEDAGLLVELLEKYNPTAEAPLTATLQEAFVELEKERIPRTAELVKRARAQGETRVVHGTEACVKRNNWYREILSNEQLLRQRFGAGN